MAAHIDGPLYFERLGRTGPVMAFIHPNPMDQSCWMYQMAHFSTWFRCLAVDLPGYGRSPTARVGLTMEDLATACWEAIDVVEAEEPVVLVGCSVGSALVPYLYRERPRRVAVAVLAGTGYSTDRGPSATARAASFAEEGLGFRWRYTFQDFSPAFRASAHARYFADVFAERNPTCDVDSIIRSFEALAASDPLLVTQVACPVLIVSGTEDALHPRAVELDHRMAHAELAVLPGAGHACQIEQPWAFDHAVLEFLTRNGLVDEGAAPAPQAPARAARTPRS